MRVIIKINIENKCIDCLNNIVKDDKPNKHILNS